MSLSLIDSKIKYESLIKYPNVFLYSTITNQEIQAGLQALELSNKIKDSKTYFQFMGKTEDKFKITYQKKFVVWVVGVVGLVGVILDQVLMNESDLEINEGFNL